MNTSIPTQGDLNYINYCQMRATADLRVVEVKTTLTASAATNTVALPDDVVRVTGLFINGLALTRMQEQDYLRLSSSSLTTADTGAAILYLILGRTLYIWPKPDSTTTVDIFYSKRSQQIDSSADLDVTGEAERLVERLVAAYKLIDDGQPELGQAELAMYLRDVVKIRRRYVRGKGVPQRFHVAGYRRRVDTP